MGHKMLPLTRDYHRNFSLIVFCNADKLARVINSRHKATGVARERLLVRALQIYSVTAQMYSYYIEYEREAEKIEAFERHMSFIDAKAQEQYPDIYDNDPLGAYWMYE
jgi:hypothetical protein